MLNSPLKVAWMRDEWYSTPGGSPAFCSVTVPECLELESSPAASSGTPIGSSPLSQWPNVMYGMVYAVTSVPSLPL